MSLDQDQLVDWTAKLQEWSKDPYSWIRDCVFTKDPTDEKNPIKRAPNFEYVQLFIKIWLVEKRIAVPKSRRMFMSWLVIILHLWDALFHKGRNMAIVSKKEDDADELVKRCLFILQNIKEEDWPSELRPKYESKFNSIKFPQLDSEIRGFPQGADQLRQFAFSRIMADEMAFWEKAKEMYSSAMPTLEGGGAITAISSAAPGFFRDLVFDELNDDHVPVPPKHYYPMQGVEVWRNVKNKFVCFQLHYSANERKRDPKYKESIRADMPYSSYMQEYEISWETSQGKPVYQDWNKKFHGNMGHEKPELGLPLFMGIDQGLSPGCVVFQAKGEDLVVLREYTAENMGAERFKEYVKGMLRVEFPEWWDLKKHYIVGIDPSALNRRDVDERTYASVWAKEFTVSGGAMGFEERKKAVEDWLIKTRKGKACFRVNLSSCPILSRGFDGEYHYPDKMFDIEPNKARPLKNVSSNCHDALQYGISVMNKYKKKMGTKPPRPTYDFSGGAKNVRTV